MALVLATAVGLGCASAWIPLRFTDVTYEKKRRVFPPKFRQVRSDAYDRWGWASAAMFPHPTTEGTSPDGVSTYRRKRTVGVRWGRLSLNYLIVLALAGLAFGVVRRINAGGRA